MKKKKTNKQTNNNHICLSQDSLFAFFLGTVSQAHLFKSRKTAWISVEVNPI